MSSSNSDNPKLSAAQACNQQNEYSQLRYSPDGVLGWLERSDRTENRAQLVCEFNNSIKIISAPGISVGSRVHEYGGRAWCWGNKVVFYVERNSQQLFQTDLQSGKVSQLTFDPSLRIMEPLWHSDSNSVIFVMERHQASCVVNEIGRLRLASGEIDTLVSGDDFYSGLALNSYGSKLAWVGWNHPNLPWTSTRLYQATLTLSGLADIHSIAGSEGDESILMPSYSKADELLYVSDRCGFWTLYRSGIEGEELLTSGARDITSSPWQSGIIQYGFDQNNNLINLEFSSAGVNLNINSSVVELSGINHFRELACSGVEIALICAGPRQAPHIVKLSVQQDGNTWTKSELTPIPPNKNYVSLPELVEFQSGSTQVHGYYYSPWQQHSEAAPLILTLHGGPTSSTYPILNPAIQFWCSQGFAVFDLNYRGSSNSGRNYRNLLKHNWGVVEVEDIDQAINHLIDIEKATIGKIFIRGRSSGGYSALLAVAQTNHFSAATSYFGVTNPDQLKTTTHKFESHYLDWLLPQRDSLNTPYKLIDKIETPILFLQGGKDAVVTPDQTSTMYRALETRGVETEVLYFENEGHGFQSRDNQAKALEAELAYYQRRL